MDPSLRIAAKDLLDVLRERSILLALLIQLFVAAFSSFLMVGLVALYDPTQAIAAQPLDVGYVGPRHGFDSVLEAERGLLVSYEDVDDALAAFRAGRLDVLVQETGGAENEPHVVTLLIPKDELRTTALVTKMKELLADYERTLRREREDRLATTVVYVDAPGRATPFFSFTYSVLLPILIITPVFISGSIVADNLTQEVNTRTLELLRSAPVRAGQIFAGKLLTPILLAPAQALLWILLLRLNGVEVHFALPLVVLAAALATTLTSLSAALALTVRRQGEAQLAYSLVVLLLALVSLLADPNPFNLIARLAVGSASTPDAVALVAYLGAALVTLFACHALVSRRLERVSE